MRIADNATEQSQWIVGLALSFTAHITTAFSVVALFLKTIYMHYNWVKVRSKDGQIHLAWELQVTPKRKVEGAVKLDRDATHWSRERLIGFAEGYVGEVLDDSRIQVIEDK